MLDEYKHLLTRLRHDKTAWDEVSYTAGSDAEGNWTDPSAQRRYGIVLCLQYDRQPGDLELIRHVLAQETPARRADPLQGYTETLRISATLLASFRDSGDVWLFWRAMNANFDTYGGMDERYLLAGGVDTTLEVVRHGDYPDRRDFLKLVTRDGVPTYSQEEIDAWLEEVQSTVAANEADEPLLERVWHALILDAIPEGRSVLDTWETQQPRDAITLRTLMFYRARLGQPDHALNCAQALLAEAHDVQERAVALHSVARFATQTREYGRALDALGQLGRLLDEHGGDGSDLGLAREMVESALDLALAAGGETGRQGFDLVMQRAEEVVHMPLVVLRKATQAAETVGVTEQSERFRQLADAEEDRIYGRSRRQQH